MYLFRLSLLVTILTAPILQSYGYGREGHSLVGAIADDRLKDTVAGAEVGKLLQGIPLAQAAVFPDQIKGWDKYDPNDPREFHIAGHPEIEKQLLAFVKANPELDQPPADPDKAEVPSHHWFHYSDVPVVDDETYEAGRAGRSRWDIVHMIDYCVRILRGEEPAENPRAITKPVALILLAHYLGDVHQPLHVGAEFFDEKGQVTNPDRGIRSLGDAGGNSIFLLLNGAPKSSHRTLHGFWDTPAVLAAFDKIEHDGQLPATGDIAAIAQYLAVKEPADWKIPPTVPLDDVGQFLADDILPTAREAHERLVFSNMQPKLLYGEVLESGFATEKVMPDGISYSDWAATVTAHKLGEAGWRLTDLLEKIFQPAPPNAVTPNAGASSSSPLPVTKKIACGSCRVDGPYIALTFDDEPNAKLTRCY